MTCCAVHWCRDWRSRKLAGELLELMEANDHELGGHTGGRGEKRSYSSLVDMA